MDRREILMKALAMGVSMATVAGATDQSEKVDQLHETFSQYPQSLIQALIDVHKTMSICKSHAIQMLLAGQDELKYCIRSTDVCLAMVECMIELVGAESGYARAMARSASDALRLCADTCRPHAAHWQCYQNMIAANRAASECWAIS